MIRPVEIYKITVVADGVIYTVEGTNAIALYSEHPEAVRLSSFVTFMKDLFYNTPEYQSLPEAEGGYL